MEAGKHSYMAEATAMLRAAHQIIDADPKVLADPLAVSLLGRDTEARVHADSERLQRKHMKGARAFAVMRSRFTEGELADAVERGVRQYVILGAGLDTFAYRNPFSGTDLRVFEVDHPDTQRWKLERLQDADVKPPDSVSYVPVDFEKQSLAEGLAAGGVDTTAPIFFSWLGVTYYLTMDAVFDTFRYAGQMAPSSQIVFDFVVGDTALNRQEREGVARVLKVVEGYGEPWLSRFDPDGLRAALRYLGFGSTQHISAEQSNKLFFAGRTDGLIAHSAIQMMSAIV